MHDDHDGMPALLFKMAATCKKNGRITAGNLLAESAVLLHICLAQEDQTTLVQHDRRQTAAADALQSTSSSASTREIFPQSRLRH